MNDAMFGWSLIALLVLGIIWVIVTVANFFSDVSQTAQDIRYIKSSVSSFEDYLQDLSAIKSSLGWLYEINKNLDVIRVASCMSIPDSEKSSGSEETGK